MTDTGMDTDKGTGMGTGTGKGTGKGVGTTYCAHMVRVRVLVHELFTKAGKYILGFEHKYGIWFESTGTDTGTTHVLVSKRIYLIINCIRTQKLIRETNCSGS